MKSARQIGKIVNLTAREINKILHEKGLLGGAPGKWTLTKLGEQYGEMRKKSNNEGGWALREWEFPMWDEKVIEKFINND